MKSFALFRTAAMFALLPVLAGCASAPRLFEVSDIYVCAAEDCGSAGQLASSPKLLSALYELLKRNEGKDFKMCSSDPKSRNCESEGLGFANLSFPFIPGRSSFWGGVMKNLRVDQASQSIKSTNSLVLFGNGVPLACSDHEATVSVRSTSQVTFTVESFVCFWLAFPSGGNWSFAVDSVDFDRGRFGGFYSMGHGGSSVGKGEGYAVMQLTESMPRGVNWLKD